MSSLEKWKKWLLKHAHKNMCPPCANKKYPDRLADSIVQVNCICPKCNRVWLYKIRPEQEIKKRIPIWYYTRDSNIFLENK